MKRTIEFQISDDKYTFSENGNIIFEINKDDLQVDVKTFYSAFFADNMDCSDIELHNSIPDNKDGKRAFGCIEQLVKEVSTRLMEDHKKPECEASDENGE
ncbi:MAG: hypothetical protein PHZ03_00350 [Syntrophomonas sp.]|nr:hypothetical protein [Syntrophomonas sp.]